MGALRLMTYNIRHARGADGRVDLGRIAAVIAAADPDVVTLQEVDAGRMRSGVVDQADKLANQLGMDARFVPCVETGDERYGIATLSRPRMHRDEVIVLPGGRFGSEPRRALVTRVSIGEGREIDVVNTHLSLRPLERAFQAHALERELEGEDLILAGDFNCTPLGFVYRKLITRLVGAGPRAATWPSRRPFLQLDHVLFRSDGLTTRDARVVSTVDTRRASDHLPVLTTFEPRVLAKELS
jgi:endonuclease/exonuclease/phosphatase family metal-dependent hydrolase